MPTPATTDQASPRLDAYLTQTLLRLYHASPALASYLESSAVKGDTVELSFFQLPDQVVTEVQSSLGCADVKTLAYAKGHHACVGFRIKPTEEELSGFIVAGADNLLPDTQPSDPERPGEPEDDRTPSPTSKPHQS